MRADFQPNSLHLYKIHNEALVNLCRQKKLTFTEKMVWNKKEGMGKVKVQGGKMKRNSYVKTISEILERERKKGNPMESLYIKGRNVNSYLKSCENKESSKNVPNKND